MLYFRRSICKIPHYNFMTAKLFVRKQVLRGCYTGIWHSQDCHGVSHYNDVIMSAMASQSPASRLFAQRFSQGADKRKHQSSASVAFVRGIHRWPVNSPHKWPINAENVSIWWRNHPSKHDINGPFVVSVKATNGRNGSMASHFLLQMARFSVAICLPFKACHEPAVNGPLKASHFTAT